MSFTTINLPHWLTFRHPHRLFWLDFPSPRLLFLYIYSAYSILLLITCVALCLRSRSYPFPKNVVSGAILAALMQWLIGTIHLFRFLTSAPLPMWLMILRNYVIFPLCLVFGIQARGMHILFDYIWTWSIGNPRLHSREGQFLLPGRAIDGISTKELQPSERESRKTYWNYIRRWLRNPKVHVRLKNNGTFLMLSLLSGMHLSTAGLLLLLNWTKKVPYHTRGPLELEDFGVAASVFLYMIIWAPLMLYYLSGMKDAYGLRNDLKAGISFALPCYILYGCFRSYDFLQPIRMEIPSFMVMLMALVSLHGTSVMLPLIRTIWWKPAELDTPIEMEDRQIEGSARPSHRHSPSPYDVIVRTSGGNEGESSIIIPYRPMPLKTVLAHPELSKPFVEYSRTAFVLDALLFYRAVDRYRQQVQADPTCADSEAYYIYEEYIMPGSPCEMNLSYPVVQRLHRAIEEHCYTKDIFDEAQEETLRLVGNFTYRNFLYSLEPLLKERYMIPQAAPINTIKLPPPQISLSNISNETFPRCSSADFAID